MTKYFIRINGQRHSSLRALTQ